MLLLRIHVRRQSKPDKPFFVVLFKLAAITTSKLRPDMFPASVYYFVQDVGGNSTAPSASPPPTPEAPTTPEP